MALLPLLSLFGTCVSGVKASPSGLPLPTRLVQQLPLGVWIENLWVRSNGDILISTMSPNASLYLVSNPAAATSSLYLLHTFESMDGILGAIETKPDTFVVAGGKFAELGKPLNGTAAVWELDFHLPSKPVAREVAAMPDAVFLNGVQAVPDSTTTVLVVDSSLGLVWRLDTLTGRYDVAIQDPAMAVVPGSFLEIGINGIKVHNGYLYWTNSFQSTIYRLRITADGYPSPGAVAEVVGKADTSFLDDLAIGPMGKEIIWSVSNLDDMLVALDPKKNQTAVVVDGSPTQLTVAGGTACQFGRGPTDKEILYVVTSGALGSPVNGTITEGAKVVAVDTTGYFKCASGKPWTA
ncbi:hypothetical protein GQ53DRAFT_634223 [Thozetella sp. PMI_491]|nr:hypothetical protein GQ53DRAFT_634223 [Thozetella sp. PMI_491]